MRTPTISNSWIITLTSAKMSMHSNSHDIQQKYDDGVPMTAWLPHNKHYKKLNHTFTMSCKIHKTSNDFEDLKVAHKQTT